MRDIVFRGKRVIDGKWVEGSLHLVGENAYIFVALDFLEGHGWYAVDPKTIGQYVGREDKHGKRIFEGDIVSSYIFDVDDGYGVVEWSDDSACFAIVSDNILASFDSCWGVEFEVVSNVYDWLELTEETK